MFKPRGNRNMYFWYLSTFRSYMWQLWSCSYCDTARCVHVLHCKCMRTKESASRGYTSALRYPTSETLILRSVASHNMLLLNVSRYHCFSEHPLLFTVLYTLIITLIHCLTFQLNHIQLELCYYLYTVMDSTCGFSGSENKSWKCYMCVHFWFPLIFNKASNIIFVIHILSVRLHFLFKDKL